MTKYYTRKGRLYRNLAYRSYWVRELDDTLVRYYTLELISSVDCPLVLDKRTVTERELEMEYEEVK